MDSFLHKNPDNIEGKRAWGENVMPLLKQNNICEGLDWDKKGYTIAPFLTEEEYSELLDNVKLLLFETLEELQIIVTKDFSFEDYHKVIGHRHIDFIERIKHIPSSQFFINKKIVEKRISEFCGKHLSNFNNTTKEAVFHLRIIRPGVMDYNPIHRDTWHWEYGNNINLYVGLIGSSEKSSLPLAEGSHYWNENTLERTIEGAFVNNVQYVVPTVTDSKNKIELIRPNPGRNKMMLFSPYLIHGGAMNNNEDKTRISLEMRFWENNW